MENSSDTVIFFLTEVLYLTFTLYNEAYGNALYATCREAWLNFSPKHRTQFETNDAVQYSACLLCVDQVKVYLPWMVYGIKYGRLCDFMEDNATCILRLKVKHFIEVPADGFSLTVFIGCQPYC